MKCDNCKQDKQVLFGFYGQSLCLPCKSNKENELKCKMINNEKSIKLQQDEIETLTNQNKELASLALWCARRLTNSRKIYAYQELLEIIGDEYEFNEFVKKELLE